MRRVNREKGYCIRIRTRAVSANFFWAWESKQKETISPDHDSPLIRTHLHVSMAVALMVEVTPLLSRFLPKRFSMRT